MFVLLEEWGFKGETTSDTVKLFRGNTAEQYRTTHKVYFKSYTNTGIFTKIWLNEPVQSLQMPRAPQQSADLMKPLRLVYSKPGFLRLTTPRYPASI